MSVANAQLNQNEVLVVLHEENSGTVLRIEENSNGKVSEHKINLMQLFPKAKLTEWQCTSTSLSTAKDLLSVFTEAINPIAGNECLTQMSNALGSEIFSQWKAQINSQNFPSKILISPSETLFTFPFNALSISGTSVAEKAALVLLPQNEVSQTIARNGKSSDKIFADGAELNLFFAGSSQFPSPFVALPQVAKEHDEIRKLFGAHYSELWNSDFTAAGLTQAPANSQKNSESPHLLHFATHGANSSLIGSDGKSISAQHIAGWLDLHPQVRFVNLNGCKTADAEKGNLSLSRNVHLSTGLPVLGALWSLDDESAKTFALFLYKELQRNGGDLGAASRFALVNLKKTPDFKHPYYWSTYQIIGR